MRWLEANQKMADILEVESPEALLQTRPIDFYPNPRIRENLLYTLVGKSPQLTKPTTIKTATGKYRYIQVSMTYDSELDYLMGTVLDLTYIHKVESTLQQERVITGNQLQSNCSVLLSTTKKITQWIDHLLAKYDSISRQWPAGDLKRKCSEILEYCKAVKNEIIKQENYAKMQKNPELTSSRCQLDVSDFLEPALKKTGKAADEKGILLECHKEECKTSLYGNREAIETAVDYILTNSLRMTDWGKITFSASCEDSNLLFTITDTSRGFTKEIEKSMEKLYYAPFYEQLEQAGGNVLEMATVITLSQLMEWEFTIHTELGKGTVYKLLIPCSLEDEDSRKKPLVAIVDDDILTRVFLKRMLSSYHLRTEEFPTGTQLIAAIKASQLQPSLIIIDQNIPEISGKETINRLKEEQLISCPVVAITARDDIPDALGDWHDEIMGKPVSTKELEKVLSSLLDCTL
jgi:CheY-like chemotaxis protein